MLEIIPELIEIVKKAGEAVLKVYSTDFTVVSKKDSSPITQADRLSDNIIGSALSSLIIPQHSKALPVLTEESKIISYSERKSWQEFWLVDPLDGTKEFVSKNGEFTINIALIRNNKPILGIIYAPVPDNIYYGAVEEGAYKINNVLCNNTPVELKYGKKRSFKIKNKQIIINQNKQIKELKVLTSRSHVSEKCNAFIKDLNNYDIPVKTISAGSSLKFCILAEDKADIYPRFGTTMEWDTAAGHAVLNSVGKKVYRHNSDKELEYNKEDLRNPWFVGF